MNDVSKNTEYVEDGIARLLEQYKNKPRITAILTAVLTECQSAENALYDAYVSRLIQNSPTGDLLDKIGKTVGQSRNGQDDDTYLLYVKTRIRTNASQGRISDLLDICALVLPGIPIKQQDYQPAAVYIYPESLVDVSVLIPLFQFLSESVLAGVMLMLVWSGSDKSNTLICGSVYGSTPTINQSPGSVYTIGTGGGKLAGVL